MTEFNLSEFVFSPNYDEIRYLMGAELLNKSKVKEFIKRLKEIEIDGIDIDIKQAILICDKFREEIDKLAGEELSGAKEDET